MGPLPPLVYVTKEQIRQMFKEGHYFERAESGEFRKSVAWERHVVSQSAPVPVCSLTQTLIYLDANGDEVAKVHQYLLRNNTLGASGLPDPKKLFRDGTLYCATD